MNVNSDNYLCILQEFCVPELSAVANMQQVISQHDGAPAHYSCEVRAFLDEQFPDRWIGCRGPVKWAPIHLISHYLISHNVIFSCGVTSSRKSMEQGLGISRLKNATETHVLQ